MKYARLHVEMKQGKTIWDADVEVPQFKDDFDLMKEFLSGESKFLCIGDYMIPKDNIAYIYRTV